MQEISLKITYFEKGLKKFNLIFSFKSNPFKWTKLSKAKRAWN